MKIKTNSELKSKPMYSKLSMFSCKQLIGEFYQKHVYKIKY